MKLLAFLVLSVVCLLANSQTLPEQKIYKYGENRTPYPLYAGSFGMELEFNDATIETLAKNFEALYGSWDIDWATARAIRQLNPDFNLQSYHGNWRVDGRDRQYVEDGHLDEILYYRLGNLHTNISSSDTVLVLDDVFGGILPSTAHFDSSSTYRYDKLLYYITFLKIGDEYLRIIDTNATGVQVNRGFQNTLATAYKKGTPVLAPVYGRAPQAGTERSYDYRHDARSNLRWKSFLRSLLYDYNKHGGGIWIDILIGNLSQYAFTGETLPAERIWDIEKNQAYDPVDRAKHAEAGIRYVQDMFYQIYDTYPVIWGNNMMFPITADNDRLRMLLQTNEKPRPIDGFAMENTFAQYGYGGHSGKEFMYETYDDWQQNVRSIMYMGELKVSARPLIMDGGIDNKKFSQLPKERRHELFMYGYASYLMGVKVEEDGSVFSQFGLCPFVYNEDGNHSIEVDPCFTWDIGKPAETYASEDYLKYKIVDGKVFVRKFEKGIVLVNPSDEPEAGISLKKYGKLFVNPDSSEENITKVTLVPHQGMILLYSK